MRFSQPIVLAAGRSGTHGWWRARSTEPAPRCCPRPFLARLAREPSRDDTVKLGRTWRRTATRGWRPRAPRTAPRSTRRPPPGAWPRWRASRRRARGREFAPECERVATTLELSAGRPLPLGPREEYARAAGPRSAGSTRRPVPLAARLRGARTPSAQAGAATDLGGRLPRRRARPVPSARRAPTSAMANARLVASLRRVASRIRTAGSRGAVTASQAPTPPRAAR